MRKHLLLVLIILLFTGKIAAQSITGTVVDAQKEPMPGVSVIVKGTTNGTVTDAQGKFELNIADASTKTLVFAFLGYKNQEHAIGRNANFNIVLEEDTKQLEELVVVGYGTQQKKLVTGAISSVSAKDIAKIPNDGRVEVALQGRTPGVIVGANSGQPGSDFTVRLRGLSSFQAGNDPLWVVDGIIVQTSNLNYLNQSDIESIDVLKDAASAAIYGTRAGNGVILVTTKKGSEGKFTVNYNGFAGTQAPARLVPMANATQYATLMNEQALADGLAMPYANPGSLGEGTNWQKAVFSNNAFRTNNEISLQGGNQNSNLYASFGYQKQDGIVLPQISGYQRYSMRINHNENFLKIFKFGQSVAYTRNESKSVGVNTEFGEAVSDALQLDPLTPIIANAEQAMESQYHGPQSAYNIIAPNGMPYGISNLVTQEVVNPIGYAQIRLGNKGYSDNIIGNSYLEINPIAGLTIRTQISINRNYWGDETFTPKYYQTGIRQQDHTSLYKHSGVGTEWNWDNTLSYNKTINEHAFGVVLGHAISRDGIGGETWITYQNVPVDNSKDANFNWPHVAADVTASTNEYIRHEVISFFGRLNYNYAQKYMATFIVRHDGSTRFGKDKKWGTFPSVSLGWVPSMEKFWTNNVNPSAIDFLKIRGSYGVTGNDSFDNFYYASTITGGNNYVFGTSGIPTLGNSPNTLENPNLKWEQTTQTDIGLDLRFLKNFNFSFDYFDKKTNGALQPVTLPQYVGVPNKPWANVGNISNTGVELLLGYNKQSGDFTVGATANFATLKNEVTSIGVGNPYAYFNEASYQNMGNLTREVVGYPIHGFWGYKTNGIFQTQADVQNYKSADGTVIQPNAKPGDFRWVDANGDGTIGPSDMVYLGSGLPTYTYGLTINLGYGNKSMGNFDFMVFFQGQGGNKIFQNYRRFDAGSINFPLDYLNRWTGPGTTNSFPRLATSGVGDQNGNFVNMSDFYLHSGDFLRIKNVQLGYSLPASVIKSIKSEKLRIYVAVENLATITSYTGFDPEIGGGVFGIDKGFYPQSRTFMAGLNVQF